MPLLRPGVLGETKGEVMLPLKTDDPEASLTVVRLMTSAWPAEAAAASIICSTVGVVVAVVVVVVELGAGGPIA